MSKSYCSLGLMSGTSMDGVDASIIQSDGETKYEVIIDKYFKYTDNIYKDLIKLRDKIKTSRDLRKFSKEAVDIEKKLTLFHAEAAKKIIKETKINVDFIGFHGQTIFHNAKEKISKQLGDGKLLSDLTKKTVINNFRENDLKNGGQGAPLSTIFHKVLVNQNKVDLPACILNLGGIANVTLIGKKDVFMSRDIGPGNCLIDEWIRINSKKKYDNEGLIARSGKIKESTLQLFQAWYQKKYNNPEIEKVFSHDTKDFDMSFVKDLSLEDGAATLTEFTSRVITSTLLNLLSNFTIQKKLQLKLWKILFCGGGRKNNYLIKSLKEKMPHNVVFKKVDDYNINGDFVESQAFAYLAIRSYLKLPISFPETTGVKKSCTGGVIFKN